MMKTNILILIAGLFFLPQSVNSQCVWTSDSYDNFEYSTAIPGLVSGTTYHPNPLSYAAHTGLKGFYMNFVNGLAGNTVVFSREYPVCVNAQYRFSTWVKEINGGSSTITLRVRDANNLILAIITNTYVNSAGWIQWNTPSLNPSTSTIYFEIVYNGGVGNNDFGMDDLKLEICSPPIVNQMLDFCVNENPVNLYDSLITTLGNTGVWIGPSTLMNGYLGTFDPSSDSAGTYSYTIADTVPNCPDSIEILDITIGLGPNVVLGNDTGLCTGDSLVLDANNVGATYLWQDNSTNETFTVLQPGTYWVQITDSCLVYSDTIVIQYSTYPLLDIGPDTVLCQGEVFTINATTSNASYLWNTNDTTPLISVNTTNSYWAQVTVNKCSIRDTIQVNFDPVPTVNLGADSTLCQGQSIILQATNSNATYLWSNGSTNPILFVNSSGTYWVEASINNCKASDTVVIYFILNPVPSLGNDTSLCDGETLLLSGYFPNSTYLWNDNSTDSVFLVNQTGTYWVEVTNSCTTVSETINVSYNAFPIVDLGDDVEFCDEASVTLDAITNGAAYLWQDNSTKSWFEVTTEGLYYVKVSVNGCSTMDSIFATVLPLPIVELGSDTVICAITPFQLNSFNPGASYTWQDLSTEPTFLVRNQGFYWVEVIRNGCSNSDSVYVNEISCEVILKMPNIFTPNSDGVNDILIPILISGVESIHTTIFNRWGDIVFVSEDEQILWNGTHSNGNELPIGVYYYSIEIIDENAERVMFNGNITLNR